MLQSSCHPPRSDEVGKYVYRRSQSPRHEVADRRFVAARRGGRGAAVAVLDCRLPFVWRGYPVERFCRSRASRTGRVQFPSAKARVTSRPPNRSRVRGVCRPSDAASRLEIGHRLADDGGRKSPTSSPITDRQSRERITTAVDWPRLVPDRAGWIDRGRAGRSSGDR